MNRRRAAVLVAAVLALGASGCSGDDAPKPGPRVAGNSAESLATKILKIEVRLGSDKPEDAARAGQLVGEALREAGVSMFSYDGSTRGVLGVQVSDRLDADERKDLNEKIAALDSDWELKTQAVDGYRFRIVAPLSAPAKNGQVPEKVAGTLNSALGPLLPSGFQARVEADDPSTLVVAYAGPVKNVPGDIEAAAVGVAKAVGTDREKVKVEPLP